MNEGRTTQFPLWLELSGLPTFLNKKVRSGAWPVFKKIVEEDCAQNPSTPGVIEMSIEQLAQRTGLDEDVVTRIVNKLRQKKLLVTFVPDNPYEDALFQIRTPLTSPLEPDEIRKNYPHLFPPGMDFFRYCDAPSEISEKDEVLKEIVDLYFNTLGLKMNTFILDELNMIRHRFALDRIKRAFQRAKHNNITSLRWVARELFREKKHENADTRK